MNPSGMATDLETKVPIIIGTIPLQHTFGNFMPAPSGFVAPMPGGPVPVAPYAPMPPVSPGGMQPSAPFYGGFPAINQYPNLRKCICIKVFLKFRSIKSIEVYKQNTLIKCNRT